MIGTWKIVETGIIIEGKYEKVELSECELKSYFTFEANKKFKRINYFIDTDISECVEDYPAINNWGIRDNYICILENGKELGSIKIIELTKDRFFFEDEKDTYFIYKK